MHNIHNYKGWCIQLLDTDTIYSMVEQINEEQYLFLLQEVDMTVCT